MHLVAVVPIFMSAGAAVLPTVAAAAASVLALLFKPRELFRLCRRRPMAACSAGALASLAILLLVWWIETPAPAHPVARVPARPDWARVAQDIIAQAPLHPAKRPRPRHCPRPRPRARRISRAAFSSGARRRRTSRRSGPIARKPRCSSPRPQLRASGFSPPAARRIWAATPACWPAWMPTEARSSGRSPR